MFHYSSSSFQTKTQKSKNEMKMSAGFVQQQEARKKWM